VVGPLQGFRSRIGKPFAAMIRLSAEFVPEFDFGQGSGAADAGDSVDFSGQQTLGSCPKCGKRIFEHRMSYVCETAVGPARTCDFRSGKIILQRPIERAQMEKLLTTGKTDLLHKFISKKGRPFSAFLVRGADGKVGFEFATRVARTVVKSQVTVYAAEAPGKIAEKLVSPMPAKKRARKAAAMPAAKKKAPAKKPRKAA
jgi:DNA topoisomerase-3